MSVVSDLGRGGSTAWAIFGPPHPPTCGPATMFQARRQRAGNDQEHARKECLVSLTSFRQCALQSVLCLRPPSRALPFRTSAALKHAKAQPGDSTLRGRSDDMCHAMILIELANAITNYGILDSILDSRSVFMLRHVARVSAPLFPDPCLVTRQAPLLGPNYICTLVFSLSPPPPLPQSSNPIPADVFAPCHRRFRHAAGLRQPEDRRLPVSHSCHSCHSFALPCTREMMITIIGAVLLSMRTQIIRTENSDLAHASLPLVDNQLESHR